MEMFSTEFWSALVAIIVIDLVLAGDNAIVIGLAARRLPKNQQRKAVFWGTFGAIFMRTLLTFLVVWLLKIPGLLLIGGVLLIWIAYSLLVTKKDHDSIDKNQNFFSAIRTIVVADTIMGLDNVLAVAGAAHGSFILVLLGLLISVPIIIWGSTLILKWVEKFPIIIYIGAGVLAWTSSKMIVDEPLIKGFFDDNLVLKWGLSILLVVGVLLLGRLKNNSKNTQTEL